jgi:copper chaperone CopZ
VISFHVPAMRSRHCVRVISGRVSDIPGVRTLEVDLGTKTVRVTGNVDARAVGAAIADAGYDAAPCDEDVPADEHTQQRVTGITPRPP